MGDQPSRSEALVLETLHADGPLSLEELTERIPDLSWNKLFQTVDNLSRRGELLLQRKGFAYYVSLPCISHLSAKSVS